VGNTLAQVTASLAMAMFDLKVITRETAATVYAKVIGELGISYNPDKELAKLDELEADETLATGASNGQLLNSILKQNGFGQSSADGNL